MPTTPTPIPDAQGSTLVFGGVKFPKLTGWKVQAGGVTLFDRTHMGSSTYGSGENVRVVKQFDVSAVEPDSIEATALGPSSFGPSDKGRAATLTLTFPDGSSLFGTAALVNYTVEGQVGDLVKTSMSFKYLGYEV